MAIKKEFSDLEDGKVWDVISKEDLPIKTGDTNGFSKLSETKLPEQDWLLVAIAKFLV